MPRRPQLPQSNKRNPPRLVTRGKVLIKQCFHSVARLAQSVRESQARIVTNVITQSHNNPLKHLCCNLAYNSYLSGYFILNFWIFIRNLLTSSSYTNAWDASSVALANINPLLLNIFATIVVGLVVCLLLQLPEKPNLPSNKYINSITLFHKIQFTDPYVRDLCNEVGYDPNKRCPRFLHWIYFLIMF
jgi:hypothetical protein